MIVRVINSLRYRIGRQISRAALNRCQGGKNVRIGSDVCWGFNIQHPERVSFGVGTALAGNCLINGAGGISFGHHCHIAPGLTVFSSNHNFRSDIAVPYAGEDTLKPVKVGDCVWIGANVSLTPGAKIGNGAIIAMGAVVRGEIPACAIVAGNPAVVIGHRDAEAFQRLYDQRAFM